VLSGVSAMTAITLLEQTSPPPGVKALVQAIYLGLSGDETSEIDLFHPGIALAQTMVDVIDPLHYARFTIREPRKDFPPKSLYVVEGVHSDGRGDSYAPSRNIEVQALAYALPLQAPMVWSPADARWGGLDEVVVPANGLSGNLAEGRATGVLAQWSPALDEDGHFVVFAVPAAEAQAAEFLRLLAEDRVGRVPPP
jgi:hypothetical protein